MAFAFSRREACGTLATRRAFYACACLLFPACQLALLIDVFGSGKTGMACLHRELTVAALGCSLFASAFAALGGTLENAHMLLGCALSTLLPLVRSWQAGTTSTANTAERSIAAASATLEVAVCAFAILLWRGFGWRAYAVVGGDVRLNAIYSAYQAFEAASLLAAEGVVLLVFAAHAIGALPAGLAVALGAVALACVPVQVCSMRAEASLALALALAVQLCVGLAAVGGLSAMAESSQAPPRWLCPTAAGRGGGGRSAQAEVEAMRSLALGTCALATATVAAVVLCAGRVTVSFGSGLRSRAFGFAGTQRLPARGAAEGYRGGGEWRTRRGADGSQHRRSSGGHVRFAACLANFAASEPTIAEGLAEGEGGADGALERGGGDDEESSGGSENGGVEDGAGQVPSQLAATLIPRRGREEEEAEEAELAQSGLQPLLAPPAERTRGAAKPEATDVAPGAARPAAASTGCAQGERAGPADAEGISAPAGVSSDDSDAPDESSPA